MKPFKGKIYHWIKQPFDKEKVAAYYEEDAGLGYTIFGYTTETPKLGTWYRTSWVVKHDELLGMIETRNSKYQLVGPEVPKNDG